VISGRLYVTAIVDDVEDMVATETRLAIQEKRYERQRTLMDSVFSDIPCPVMQFYYSNKDDAYLLVNCNEAAFNLFGYSDMDEFKKDINGKKKSFVADENEDFFKAVDELTAGRIEKYEAEVNFKRRDGSEKKCKDALSRIVHGDQIFIQHIITE